MMVHVQGNWFCLLYGSDGQVPNCPTDELSFSSRTGPNQMSLTWRHLHQFCKLTLFQCSMVWRNPREVHFGILKQASRSEYVFFIEKSLSEMSTHFNTFRRLYNPSEFFHGSQSRVSPWIVLYFSRKVNWFCVVLLLRCNWHYSNSVACNFLLPNVSKAFAHTLYVLATGRTSRS